MYFETHCHLNDIAFEDGVLDYLRRARDNGCVAFNVVAWDIASSKKAIQMEKDYIDCFASVGIHPENVKEATKDDLAELVRLIDENHCKAVGEIGLDYHFDKDEMSHIKQQDFFARQIAIANAFDIPIVVHSRDAIMDTYEVLRDNPVRRRGIIHCYSGSPEMAVLFVNLGFLIGIGGVVTFKNAQKMVEVVKEIPLQYLVVETDCPYLTPEPYRGKKNEPSYIPYIIKRIAEIKEVPVEEVERVTTENAKTLFNFNASEEDEVIEDENE